MTRTILSITALLCATVIAWGQNSVQVVAAPEGANLKDTYSVRVRVPGGVWQKVDTYAFAVAHNGVPQRTVDTVSVAPFSFEGEVEVEITHLKADIDSFRVRPLSYGIEARQQGRTLSLKLTRPRYLSIECNGDIFDNLHLLADSLCSPPAHADITFAPGLHKIDGDSLLIPSNSTVYIAPGAVVKGWLCVADAEDVRVLGQGIILPSDGHGGVEVRRSRRVLVDGPLTTRLPIGESDSVEMRNAKVFSSFAWGDGFNLYGCSYIRQHHLFARTSDDCSTVYCTRMGYHGSSHHIRISDAVYWPDVAHPIMIGIHGDIDKNEEVHHVVYEDIDVLEHCEYQVDYQGCIAINDGDNVLVHDLTFKNFRIESMREGMLLNLRVCFNQKYCRAPGRGISNITLSNISYTGAKPNIGIITGYNEERVIEGLHFEGLTVNGLPVYDAMPERPTWYKTADFAPFFIGEHVHDVTFAL